MRLSLTLSSSWRLKIYYPYLKNKNGTDNLSKGHTFCYLWNKVKFVIVKEDFHYRRRKWSQMRIQFYRQLSLEASRRCLNTQAKVPMIFTSKQISKYRTSYYKLYKIQIFFVFFKKQVIFRWIYYCILSLTKRHVLLILLRVNLQARHAGTHHNSSTWGGRGRSIFASSRPAWPIERVVPGQPGLCRDTKQKIICDNVLL